MQGSAAPPESLSELRIRDVDLDLIDMKIPPAADVKARSSAYLIHTQNRGRNVVIVSEANQSRSP